MKKSHAWRMAAEWLEREADSINPEDMTPLQAEVVKHIRTVIVKALGRKAQVIAQKERP